MPDRSTIIAGLAVILRRLAQLAEGSASDREELERKREETQALQSIWRRLMLEFFCPSRRINSSGEITKSSVNGEARRGSVDAE
jgi:hypothetical protein